MFFKKKEIDAQKLGEDGENVAHGFSHYYKKEHPPPENALRRIWEGLLDFGEGFYRREATKDSKPMRFGVNLAKFADGIATNVDANAKREANKKQ